MKVQVALTNTNLYRNVIIEHLDLSNNRVYFTSSIQLAKEDDKYIFNIKIKEEKKKK